MSVGVYAFAKVNYLDTDQWYDMIGYDFPGTAASRHDAIFDGAKNDYSSAKHEKAFGVLKNLNKTIEQQNIVSARPDGSDNFKRLAVSKWLALHETDAAPVPPIGRGIEVVLGEVWNANNPGDEELLGLLNRFCFRCHSSLKWSVFDRGALFVEVFKGTPRKDVITGFVAGGVMPQGRELEQLEKDAILRYVRGIE
jgi:hypothetical protein